LLSALETAAEGYKAAETIRRIKVAKRAQAAAAAAKLATTKSPPSESSSSTAKKSCLTPEERDQFHAENHCFYCCEIGHTKNNCPTLHTAPAPKVRSAVATVSNDHYTYLQSLSIDNLDKEV
jgi:hypothetical protein